jgi:hypothetical protein
LQHNMGIDSFMQQYHIVPIQLDKDDLKRLEI